MALATRLPVRPSTVPIVTITDDQAATINMLRSCGLLSDRDAARLSVAPAALDDVVVLALLHERHELTHVEYEFEKGERLRVSG